MKKYDMHGKTPEQVSRESFMCQFEADGEEQCRYHELGSLARIATALERHNQLSVEVLTQMRLIRKDLRALRSDRALIAPTKK